MKHEITSLNTKRILAESLKRLMKEKPFSKITISEIIADCGVNRKTFYYHFENIYSLLKWIFEVEAIEIVKHFDLVVDYEEAITFVMDYVETNDYLINCAYDSIGRDEMSRFFFADFIELTTALIHTTEQELGVSVDEDYKAFLSVFYTEAFAGILIEWIKNRNARNRKKVTEYLSNTIKISLTALLGSK